ncbi:hypothetical protein ACTA71_007647 [Dictyostelium dimigraforme]
MNKKLDQELTCCICLSPFNVSNLDDKDQLPHRLPLCSHQFHKGCIEGWFQRGSRTCAYCRKDYSSFSKKDLVSHDQTVTQLLLEIQYLKQNNNNNDDNDNNSFTLKENSQINNIGVKGMEMKSNNIINTEDDDSVSCSRSIRNGNNNNQEEEEGFLKKTMDYFKENPLITGLLGGVVMFAALSATQSLNKDKEEDKKKNKK